MDHISLLWSIQPWIREWKELELQQGIRDFIKILEAAGESKRVKAEVDPRFEIAGVL